MLKDLFPASGYDDGPVNPCLFPRQLGRGEEVMLQGDLDLSCETPASHRDPLADLLGTPLKDLPATLEVFSAVLGETIFLVADDAQAAAVWAKGGVPYTPPEVAILRELEAAARPETWADRLRLIHQAKKDFQARLRRET